LNNKYLDSIMVSVPILYFLQSKAMSIEMVCDGVRVNLITHIPCFKDCGPQLKNWLCVALEGAGYIYRFDQKCLCLKVNYASPLIEEAITRLWLPIPIIYQHHRSCVGQYLSHNNTSMRAVCYDDGACVYASPSNNVYVVHRVDIEMMLVSMKRR
jgi:hypothetical protein